MIVGIKNHKIDCRRAVRRDRQRPGQILTELATRSRLLNRNFTVAMENKPMIPTLANHGINSRGRMRGDRQQPGKIVAALVTRARLLNQSYIVAMENKPMVQTIADKMDRRNPSL
jgi:hypothetical protein